MYGPGGGVGGGYMYGPGGGGGGYMYGPHWKRLMYGPIYGYIHVPAWATLIEEGTYKYIYHFVCFSQVPSA